MAELDRVAVRAAADDLLGMCSDRGYSDAVSVLRDAAPALLDELERTEGDLEVAVHEATTARATVQRVREALRTRETGLSEAIPPSLRSAAVASGAVKVTTGEIYAALAAPVQPEETQHG